jgi:hypothetical protein
LAICCLALALDSWCNYHTYLVRDATERVLHGTKCILVKVSCTSRISIEPQAQSMSKPAIRNRSSSSSSREWEISARHVVSVRIAAYACVMGRSRCYAAARCSTSSSRTLRRIGAVVPRCRQARARAAAAATAAWRQKLTRWLGIPPT